MARRAASSVDHGRGSAHSTSSGGATAPMRRPPRASTRARTMSSWRTWSVEPSASQRKPSAIPTTSTPRLRASIVAALMTPLMPGAGPPPTRMPRRWIPRSLITTPPAGLHPDAELLIDWIDEYRSYDEEDRPSPALDFAAHAYSRVTPYANLLQTHYLEERDRLHAASLAAGGPGLEPEQLQQLNRRGQRLDESVAGHGLGLGICRDILDYYRGSLVFSRSELGGLCVKVKVPLT